MSMEQNENGQQEEMMNVEKKKHKGKKVQGSIHSIGERFGRIRIVPPCR